jgi:hypothetical protein
MHLVKIDTRGGGLNFLNILKYITDSENRILYYNNLFIGLRFFSQKTKQPEKLKENQIADCPLQLLKQL